MTTETRASSAVESPPESVAAVDGSHEVHLLNEMIRIRRFEERCADLYKEEKIRGFLHLYIG